MLFPLLKGYHFDSTLSQVKTFESFSFHKVGLLCSLLSTSYTEHSFNAFIMSDEFLLCVEKCLLKLTFFLDLLLGLGGLFLAGSLVFST
jgi:hypothetical protein